MSDTAVAPVADKPWFKKRTIWISIVTATLASIQPITTAFGHPVQVPLWVYEFLGGAGLYTLRTAIPAK